MDHQQGGDHQSDLFSERGNQRSLSPTAMHFRAPNDVTIDLIQTKEYSNVNKIADRDHLTDEN
jgi:hypothetical protein